MLERYLQVPVEADLEEKMVFVAGPRQVGKTTLAKQILARAPAGEYLSWDRRQDRQLLRAARWPASCARSVRPAHATRHGRPLAARLFA